MDCSLPGSSVYGICQARLLEWVAISFSRGSSWPRDKTYASCIGRGILYHSATREALMYLYISYIFMLERGKSFYSCMRHWCLVWYLGQSSYLGNCSWETLSVRFYASGRQISRLISSLKFLSYCVRGAVWCLLLLCVRHQYFFMFSISCVCDKQKSTSNEVEWSEWSLLHPPGFCFYMYLEEVPISVSDSLDSILKSRDFTNKGLSSHSYGFSSSYVWMWELDYKESWAQNN